MIFEKFTPLTYQVTTGEVHLVQWGNIANLRTCYMDRAATTLTTWNIHADMNIIYIVDGIWHLTVLNGNSFVHREQGDIGIGCYLFAINILFISWQHWEYNHWCQAMLQSKSTWFWWCGQGFSRGLYFSRIYTRSNTKHISEQSKYSTSLYATVIVRAGEQSKLPQCIGLIYNIINYSTLHHRHLENHTTMATYKTWRCRCFQFSHKAFLLLSHTACGISGTEA